jgi:hypothetical protein
VSKFSGLVPASRRGNVSATQKVKVPDTQKSKEAAEAARIGRPPGKRSDAEYRQVTAYIRRETYADARKLLFDEAREFSDLVQDRVAEWVRTRVRKNQERVQR